MLRCPSPLRVAAMFGVARDRRTSTTQSEADETVLWLELLVDTDIVSQNRMASLLVETNELLAIFAASQHTARLRSGRIK